MEVKFGELQFSVDYVEMAEILRDALTDYLGYDTDVELAHVKVDPCDGEDGKITFMLEGK